MTNDELKPKVLLIDDDRVAHERFQDLARGRYRLYSAFGGEEGLTLALRHMPDLILLDVMMPVTDGLTVCSNLRAHPLLCDIPIIMLTALDDQETRLKSMMEGADEFLNKPFNELEMSLRLKNILQINRYRRLQNERARTQWLLNSAEEAFLILDEQLNIQYANNRAGVLLNLSQPVGLGESANFQLAICGFNSEPRTLWNNWLANPMAGENAGLHLFRPGTRALAGKTLLMRTHVHQVQNSASILVRLTDITSEAMAQLNSWCFHYHVSHKLFTPLTGLKGGLELLEQSAASKLDQSELELFEVAMKSTMRLLADCRKVVDFLEISQISPPQGSFTLKNISALCGEIWSSKGIRMAECGLDAKLLNRAVAVPEITLNAILAELTVNSCKFSLAGPPQIRVRIEASTKDMAVLRFSDAGKHIPPEQIDYVFRPHFQAEKTFTGSLPGMGLGLCSIALQIWQLGGSFAIKNNDFGTGVTVTLELPLIKLSEPEESPGQQKVPITWVA